MSERGALERDRANWNLLAEADPLWAVSTRPEFHGDAAIAEFFATGEQDVAGILEYLSVHGLVPARGRALDFGCGLGRLSRALAGRFEHVVAVDVSEVMIERARRLDAGGAVEYRAIAPGGLGELPDASFDFVLSLAVLQHMSSRAAIRRSLRGLARVTRPGGLIVFQLPADVPLRIRAPRRLARLAPSLAARSARLRPWLMALNALPEDEVRATLGAAGAQVLAAIEDNRVGSAAVRSLAYCARAGSSA